MSREEIRSILDKCKTIAVVGLSRESTKESYIVSEHMQKHGFRIIPVNPFAYRILGEKSYKSLSEIPENLKKRLDIVDVFRKAEDVPPVAEQAVKLKKKYGKPCVFWMQLGIVNHQAAEIAREVGMTVVMDKCLMREHRRLSK
ncbi:MAG TPA: CoA-binding protein [Candidatus Bathyarchaeia archaeon]